MFGRKKRDTKDEAERRTVSDWLLQVGGRIDDRDRPVGGTPKPSATSKAPAA